VNDLAGSELVAALRRLQPKFENAGVSAMILFGSRARGDHRPESDVDIMIEVRADQRFSLLDLVGVGHIVEDHLDLPANVFMRRSMPDYILEKLAADKVEVFG
jgi:hypothetical protein